MKRLKKTALKMLALVLSTVLVYPFAIPAVSAQDYSMKENMARTHAWMEQAMYGKEPVPEDTITYEQLIIMVCEAFDIKPGSCFANSITNRLVQVQTSASFSDTYESDLEKRGYLKTALDFGLLIPTDYFDNQLLPFRPAARSDAVTLITRGLGLVYPAGLDLTNGEIPFADWETIPDWQKGYASVLKQEGVLLDEYARLGDVITLGELAELLCRAYDEMTEGVDTEIRLVLQRKLYIPEKSKKEIINVPTEIQMPIQIVDNVVYVPARPMYWLYDHSHGYWTADNQCCRVSYGLGFFVINYVAGYNGFKKDYEEYNGLYDTRFRTRLLYGETMVPVLDLNTGEDYKQTDYVYEAFYDAENKIVTVYMAEPPSHTS